jgi:diacyltrehalose acyltransferase
VAKHRKAGGRQNSTTRRAGRHRQSPSVVLVGTTAAALSAVLVFGHATNTTADSPQVELTAATIGVGGRGDPNAVNIPNKLQGKVVPPGYTYVPVHYPANFDIDNSVNAGVPALQDKIDENSTQDHLLVVGYSEGALVAERVRRNLDPSDPGAPSTTSLQFVMIAAPNLPNGGLAARFPAGFGIPFFVTSNGPAQPSPYDTQYVTNEYDPYADFPAYFNPLSLANSLVAVMYVHPDAYYDSVNYDPISRTSSDPNVLIKKDVPNSAGGHDTYVFVKAEHLPLFAPVRQVAGIVHLTPLTEPLLGAIEPLVRVLVDMGYTDRENLNPEQHVQFSLITPPGKVFEAAAAVPGALGQGVTNLVTGVGSLPGSIPTPLAPTVSPSISAKTQEPQLKLATADPTPPDTTQDGQDNAGSGTSTEPPVTTLSDPGPTLGEITGDGHKATPSTPGKTTSPKKNPLTQLADTVKGFFSPKKPAPSSDPTNSTSAESPAQGPTSNAA